MQIVPYTENLQNQVVGFAQNIWAELGKAWEPEGIDKDFFDIINIYQKSGGEFWVMLDKEKVIGTIALKPLKASEVELKRFYVDAVYRGKGIGKQLINQAIEAAKEKGFKTIKLDTSKKLNQALGLFRKIGFKEIDPYLDNNRSDTFMELSLVDN